MGQKRVKSEIATKKGQHCYKNKGKCNGILYITNINRPEEKPSFRVPTPGTSFPRGIINDTYYGKKYNTLCNYFLWSYEPFHGLNRMRDEEVN